MKMTSVTSNAAAMRSSDIRLGQQCNRKGPSGSTFEPHRLYRYIEKCVLTTHVHTLAGIDMCHK